MHILKETINHIIKSRVSFSKKLNKTSYNLKIGGKKKNFLQFLLPFEIHCAVMLNTLNSLSTGTYTSL